MQEAWLLFDEGAIRRAAGNPRGTETLRLPRSAELEKLPDPKHALHSALKAASGLSGRRLRSFLPHRAARLVGQYITDFSALRVLSAFAAFETDVAALIAAQDW